MNWKLLALGRSSLGDDEAENARPQAVTPEISAFGKELYKHPRFEQYKKCQTALGESLAIKAESAVLIQKKVAENVQKSSAASQQKDGGLHELQALMTQRTKMLGQRLKDAQEAYTDPPPDGSSIWDMCSGAVAYEQSELLLMMNKLVNAKVFPKMPIYEDHLKHAFQIGNRSQIWLYKNRENILEGKSEQTPADFSDPEAPQSMDFFSTLKDQCKYIKTQAGRAMGKYLISSNLNEKGNTETHTLEEAYKYYEGKWVTDPQTNFDLHTKAIIAFEQGGIALSIAQDKTNLALKNSDEVMAAEITKWHEKALNNFKECASYGDANAFVENKWNCWHQMATTASLLGHEEAANAFENAIRLDPRNPTIHKDFGLHMKVNGDYEGSLKALAYAAKIAPDDLSIGKLYQKVKTEAKKATHTQSKGSGDKEAYEKKKQEILKKRKPKKKDAAEL